MSDTYRNTSSETEGESIACCICNQLEGQVVTVIPWDGSSIQIQPQQGNTFTLFPGTNIRIQRTGDSITVRLFGHAATITEELRTNVELALTTDMSLNLTAENLMKITLIQPLYHKDPTQIVKCGEGSAPPR
ncbi:MAG TPA: hypothetical protein VGD69_12610 [Herpetosiphonaceae bacterium]